MLKIIKKFSTKGNLSLRLILDIFSKNIFKFLNLKIKEMLEKSLKFSRNFFFLNLEGQKMRKKEEVLRLISEFF